MAINFLDQLLNLAGLKLPEAKERYDPSVYIQEDIKPAAGKPSTANAEPARANKTAQKEQATSTLTGVAKYIAKQQPQTANEAQSDAGEPKTAQLSRVARYVAKLEQEAREKAEAEAANLSNMSGVERYLARLEGKTVAPPSQTPVTNTQEEIKPTRVERYLSSRIEKKPAKTVAAPAKPVAKETKPATKPVEPQAKQPVPAPVSKQAPPAKPAEKKVSKPSAPIKKEPEVKTAPTDKIIDLTVNGEQCHATTSMGKRCRRSTGLKVIERTIDGKRYRFYACPQHNNNDFQPSPELLT